MRLILFFLFSFLSTQIFAQAQNDTLVRLNRHYFEIAPEDTINHVYNMQVSPLGNSAELVQIFTLDQGLIRVVLTKHSNHNYFERVTEQYGNYSQLEWRKIENFRHSEVLTQYFFNDEVVGHVLLDSLRLLHIARNGETEPSLRPFNDFEPQTTGPKEDLYEFVQDKFRLSAKLYPKNPEEYWIAVLVNPHGMVDQIEWANPLEGNPKIAEQYIRVVKLWGNNFSPALDAFGHPVSKWMLIPFQMFGGVFIKLDVINPHDEYF